MTKDIYISDHKIVVANKEVYTRGGCKLDFRFFLYYTAHQHPAQKDSMAWPASTYEHLRDDGTLF